MMNMSGTLQQVDCVCAVPQRPFVCLNYLKNGSSGDQLLISIGAVDDFGVVEARLRLS